MAHFKLNHKDSSATSTADSSGESVVSSQLASEGVSSRLLASAAVAVDGGPAGNGKTASDIASALLREENARPRSAEAAIVAASAATVDIGQFASQVNELVASLAASSAGTITPMPVTTGYEQASQSVLVSQLTAAGYHSGLRISDFIKVNDSAVASLADSKTASSAAIPADSKATSEGASSAASSAGRPVAAPPYVRSTDFGSSPPLEAARTPKGPTS